MSFVCREIPQHFFVVINFHGGSYIFNPRRACAGGLW